MPFLYMAMSMPKVEYAFYDTDKRQSKKNPYFTCIYNCGSYK